MARGGKIECLEGQVFGRLTVIEMAERNTSNKVQWLCRCVCGNISTTAAGSLKNGSSKSCGCLRREFIKECSTITGESQTPLGQIYNAMFGRCRIRQRNDEQCFVTGAWADKSGKGFYAFKEWALSQGWEKGMHICRNGDVGDYNEDNCRVGSCQENLEEAHAKHYTFVSPLGAVTKIYNLSKFCKEGGLECRRMYEVHSLKRGHHKGWTII